MGLAKLVLQIQSVADRVLDFVDFILILNEETLCRPQNLLGLLNGQLVRKLLPEELKPQLAQLLAIEGLALQVLVSLPQFTRAQLVFGCLDLVQRRLLPLKVLAKVMVQFSERLALGVLEAR